MMEFRGMCALLSLTSWCTGFQPRHETVYTLRNIPGHVQLPHRLNSLAPFQNLFCLKLRGGQGERKQRSEDKAKKSAQASSSSNKILLRKSLNLAKNRDVQADVPHSNDKMKSKSEDEQIRSISNPISESDIDFSQLTLKV
jgi:hypothetical protein